MHDTRVRFTLGQYISESLGAEALRTGLELFVTSDNVIFESRRPRTETKGPDPTILVAVVAASGGALTAILSGLWHWAAQRSAKTIVIVSRSGARIEAPVDISSERLNELVATVRNLDDDRPRLILP